MRLSLISWAAAAVLVIAPGCKKKTPIAVVPPPPPAAVEVPQPVEPSRSAPAPSRPVVTEARPAPVLAVTPAATPKSIAERLAGEVADAYFDFDKSFIRDDAKLALTRNVDALKRIMADFAHTTIIIEGHCDERGSAEYNVGLGDRRGYASKEFLTKFGLDARRLMVVSYGKERPQCSESNEDCWQKNRRVHFVPGEMQRPGSE